MHKVPFQNSSSIPGMPYLRNAYYDVLRHVTNSSADYIFLCIHTLTKKFGFSGELY